MPALCSLLIAGLNVSSTLITLVSLGMFIAIAVYVYRLSLPPVYPVPIPWNISGGLIFVVLVLILRQLTAIWGLVQLEVWGAGFWENVSVRFESGKALLLKFIIAMEIVTNTYLITGSAFLLLLFFKTRDIFPRTFLVVLISQETLVMLDSIGVSLLFGELVQQNVAVLIIQSVFRWIVIGLLTTYVMRSERSKNTFVLPHSSQRYDDDPDFLSDLEDENKKGTY